MNNRFSYDLGPPTTKPSTRRYSTDCASSWKCTWTTSRPLATLSSYEARDPTMALYLAEVRRLAHHFDRLSVIRIPRMQNMRANALARLASALDSGGALAHEFLMAPIVPTHDITGTEVSPSWMEEILCFKKDGTYPDDPTVVR